MAEKKFAKGDIIFREGDEGDSAYTVSSGNVEILKHADHGEVQLAMLQPGAVFGEMSLFTPGTQRSATARAASDAVVDIIDAADFQKLVDSCPPRLLPIVKTVFDRLRTTNQRVTKVEQATVVLDSDIQKITLNPAGEKLKGAFKDLDIPIARLPFNIGGYPEDGEINKMDQNHVNIPSDGPPLTVSRRHCQVAVQDGGLYLVDLGSRFCTWVNGVQVGRGRGQYRAALQKGDNSISLGRKDSPYQLTITCE